MLNKLFNPLKKYLKTVNDINELIKNITKYTQAEARERTFQLKHHLSKGQNIDSILVEAFALVQCAAERMLGLRHYDVQLIGGIALHKGIIAEMKTGEGKTLTATLAAYLNALECKGVHIITLNDYLAVRDYHWMKPVYEYLGLSVGYIEQGMDNELRKQNYSKDITYGCYSEYCFDYLRDHMKYDPNEIVQRDLNYVIIDDIDAVLIDEGRTPIIISGPSDLLPKLYSKEIYIKIDQALHGLTREWKVKDNPPSIEISKNYHIPMKEVGQFLDQYDDEDTIIKGDFILDEKKQTIGFTSEGFKLVSKRLSELLSRPDCFEGLLNVSIYNIQDLINFVEINHNDQIIYQHIFNALRANYLYIRDVDYIVKNDEIVIIDEVTGRPQFGRRYSDGLHTALEANENLNLRIEPPSRELATITTQNYFTKYRKISGMTGTALTVKDELKEIYNIRVIEIPTNKPISRKDHPDVIYKSKNEKYNAVINEVQMMHNARRPVLVGTTAIEISEILSKKLQKLNIPHHVLNAKHIEKEAFIISQAGQKGAVTVSTNMAGRGTDIILGEGIAKLGGLHIIGTDRHESRRIDDQLRGRAGRQGDPGSSRFYLSLEDDLLRIFGGERIVSLMNRIGMEEGEPIEHSLISNAIERAQKKIESHHYSIRKQLLDYDDILHVQRNIIYNKRQKILYCFGSDIHKFIETIIFELCENAANTFCLMEEPSLFKLNQIMSDYFKIQININKLDINKYTPKQLIPILTTEVMNMFYKKMNEIGEKDFYQIEKYVLLQTIDKYWQNHLENLSAVRKIGLFSYLGTNPLSLYKEIAFKHFEELLYNIRSETTNLIFRIERFQPPDDISSQKEKTNNNMNDKATENKIIDNEEVQSKVPDIDKAINNHNLLLGKLIITDNNKKDTNILTFYQEKIDSIFANPFYQIQSINDTSCSFSDIEKSIRILAIGLNAIKENECLNDLIIKIVKSATTILEEIYLKGNDDLLNDIAVGFYLLKFFSQMRSFIDHYEHTELTSLIKEKIQQINEYNNDIVLNLIFEHLAHKTLYKTRRDQIDQANIMNCIFIQKIYDLTEDKKNHYLISLLLELIENYSFYKQFNILHISSVWPIIEDYFMRYLKMYEDQSLYDISFVNNLISLLLFSIEDEKKDNHNISVLMDINEFLKSYFNTFLIRKVLSNQDSTPKNILAEHLQEVSDIFSRKGYGKISFYFELANLLVDRSYREGINKIAQNAVLVNNSFDTIIDQHFTSGYFRMIVLSHLLYFVEESLIQKSNYKLVLNEVEKIFEKITYQHINKISNFILEIYRLYFAEQSTEIKIKLFSLFSSDEFQPQLISLKSMNLELQFTIAIKILIIFNEGWECFFMSINNFLKRPDQYIFHLFQNLFSNTVLNTFLEYDKALQNEEHIPSSRLTIFINELFILMNSNIDEKRAKSLEKMIKQNRILSVLLIITNNYKRINNRFLLFQFITFYSKNKYFDTINNIEKTIIIDVAKRVSTIIYNIYKELTINHWHPYDRFIIEKINSTSDFSN